MVALALLALPAWAGDVTIDFATPFSANPLPAEEVTVSWSYALTQGATPAATPVLAPIEIRRPRDAQSREIVDALVRQTALGAVTVTYTPDAGAGLTVTIAGAQLRSYDRADTATDRAAEAMTLRATGAVVEVAP